MNTPAAMARIAKMTAKPPIEIKADKPVRMSQIANNRKPIFFVNFIVITLSFSYLLRIGLYSYYNKHSPTTSIDRGVLFSSTWGIYIF
jgi:hypothetical protein